LCTLHTNNIMTYSNNDHTVVATASVVMRRMSAETNECCSSTVNQLGKTGNIEES
jgi:hypothetical protein